MQMKLAVCVIAIAASGTALADKAHEVANERLAALKTAAKCSDKASVWRPWCIAADYETGTAGELPAGKVLVGMTIELEVGKDVGVALSDKVSFVAFAVGKDGMVKLTDVKPTSKDETQAVGEAIVATTLVFKDKAKTAKLPKELADYVHTLTGGYQATKSGTEWTWTGAAPSRMRKVGNYWVVIETPSKNDGVFATILTDAWE